MYQDIILWGMLITLITTPSYTQDIQQVPIHTLYSWKQAVEIFDHYDPGVLVLLDVDHTLIIQDPYDVFALGKYAWPDWLKEHAIATYPVLAEQKIWDHFYSIIWKHAPRFLTEPEVIEALYQAHKCGHTVMALTLVESGRYGVIDSTPDWRYAMLEKMGITFSSTIPDMILNQLPSHRDEYPLIHKGIICCNECAKGMVLQELLRVTRYRPHHIIFIDDSLANVYSVRQTCIELNIPCTLYHYNYPLLAKPDIDVDDFMRKVSYVLENEQYPPHFIEDK